MSRKIFIVCVVSHKPPMIIRAIEPLWEQERHFIIASPGARNKEIKTLIPFIYVIPFYLFLQSLARNISPAFV